MIAHFESDLLVLAPQSSRSHGAATPPGLRRDPEPEARQWLTWQLDDSGGVIFLVDVVAGVLGAVTDATEEELAAVKACPGKPWLETARVFVPSWPVSDDEQSAVLRDDPIPEIRSWHRWRVCEVDESMLFLIDMKTGELGVVCGATAEEAAEVRKNPFTPWPHGSRVKLQK